MTKRTPKDNLAELLFDLEVELNLAKQNKNRDVFLASFQALKELNIEYFEIYNEFFVDSNKISEYNKVLRDL